MKIRKIIPVLSNSFKTMIGGQALIEGILMMGPEKKSTVIRKQDGTLEIKTEPRNPLKEKYPIAGLPFIRGVLNFGSSLYNGMRALMYSAEFFPDDDEAEEKKDSRLETWLDKHFGNEKMTSFIITVSMVFGIVFSVALFILLPTALGGLLSRLIPGIPIWGRNLAEGIIRIIVFLLYLALCSKMHDIHRTFEYHGAEHKTIFCYEAGLPLTVENVRKQSKHHPRCGTSFLFVVVIVSILLSSVLFSFIHVENTLSRMGLHLLLLPLIVSVTYEINRFVGGHDNLFCRIIRAPGLWIQRFTTFEPDDSMIEVGIRALEEVIPEGKGKDAW